MRSRAAVDLVVDASVVFKCLVAEPGSEAALALLRENSVLAPDFLLLECRNAILNGIRRRKLPVERARLLERDLEALELDIVPSRMFASQAFALAIDLDHPIYDCIY